MELYLFKSAAILAILFAFYKLVLENTSIHNFKRFYLFGILAASFLIPFITFTSYVEVSPIFYTYTEGNPQIVISKTVESINYWPFVLWTIYGLGVLFFSLKFFRNLFSLIQQIRTNPKYRNNGFINILLSENVIPHTFFSYIFLNKQQFEKGEIPAEVILHEQTHALQKHSLDVIFVELLQIVFWFNPLFYFLKRSIKLNHEFLADRAVLDAGAETTEYQKVLLAFSSNAFSPTLANSINYSSIKKRFTVMKTHTSKRAIWLRSLLILPLLSVLIYGFSTKETVEIKADNNYVSTNDTIEDIHILIDEDSNISLNGKLVALTDLKSLINKMNTHLSVAQKQKYLSANIEIKNDNVQNLAEKVGEILYTNDIRSWSVISLKAEKDAGLKHIPQNNPKAGKTVEDAEILYKQEQAEIEKYKKARQNTRKDENNPWSIQVSEPAERDETTGKIIQQKATKDELTEYNKLAKKYKAVAIEKRIIPLKDLKRLETIYKKMTDAQKANAETFPECLPPQKSATNNSTPQQNKNLSDATIYYNNKVITLEEANDLVEKNKVLSMNVIKLDDGRSKVIITEKPILDKKATEPPKAPTLNNKDRVLNISKSDKTGFHFNTNENINTSIPVPSTPSFYNDNRNAKSDGSTIFKYEDLVITTEKANELLFNNQNKIYTLITKENGQDVIYLSRSPMKNGKKINISLPVSKTSKEPSAENRNLYMAAEAPPAPNANKLEYVKELAKRGAIFYIGPNKYTSEEAIELVKKSTNEVTIDVSKYPIVHLGGC